MSNPSIPLPGSAKQRPLWTFVPGIAWSLVLMVLSVVGDHTDSRYHYFH